MANLIDLYLINMEGKFPSHKITGYSIYSSHISRNHISRNHVQRVFTIHFDDLTLKEYKFILLKLRNRELVKRIIFRENNSPVAICISGYITDISDSTVVVDVVEYLIYGNPKNCEEYLYAKSS